MADTYYAWSNISKEATADGKPQTLIKAGEKVTKGNFTDDDWDYFVANGVVRTTPYPDLSDWDGSPNDYYRAKLEQAGSLDAVEALTTKDVKSLQDAGLLPADVEPATSSK